MANRVWLFGGFCLILSMISVVSESSAFQSSSRHRVAPYRSFCLCLRLWAIFLAASSASEVCEIIDISVKASQSLSLRSEMRSVRAGFWSTFSRMRVMIRWMFDCISFGISWFLFIMFLMAYGICSIGRIQLYAISLRLGPV